MLREILEMKAKKKVVIRNGKKVKKFTCDKEGYKVKGKECVKMSKKEILKREKGAKKGAKKAKSHLAQAIAKRKKSDKIRTQKGL